MFNNRLYTWPLYVMTIAIPLLAWWKGGKAIDATWLLGALAIMATLDICMHRKQLTKTPPAMLSGSLGAFAVLTVISWFYSSVRNYGFDEVIHTVSVVILFIWFSRRLYDLSSKAQAAVPNYVGSLVTVTLSIASCIGVLVYIAQPVNRLVGTFFDYRFHTDYWPNAWAQFCVLCLPLVLWFIYSKTQAMHSRLRYGLWCLAGMCTAAFLLSYSRGALIAAIGQLVVWCVIVVARKDIRVPLRAIATFTGTVAAVAVCSFLAINAIRSTTHEVQSIQDKVQFTAAEGKISINERAQFWQQSIELIPQKPWFGYGPYAFRFVQPRLQQHVLATSDHPHNVFLKIALERGVLAAMAFTLFIVLLTVTAFTTLVLRKPVQVFTTHPGFVVAVLCSVLGVIAHNLIDYNLQFVGIVLPLFLGCSILAVAFFTPKKVQAVWYYALFGCVLTVVLFREGLYLVETAKGRAALASQSYESAIPYLHIGTEQWFSRDTHISLMDAFVLTNQPKQAIAVFNEYRSINNHDARAWKLKADACRQQKDLQCALEAYSTSWSLSPYNDIAPLHWYIQTLADRNDTASIDANMTEVDNIINDYQYAIMHGVHHIGLSSNVEELAGLLDLLARLYPEKKALYVGLKENILQKAQKDRDFVASRKPGALW